MSGKSAFVLVSVLWCALCLGIGREYARDADKLVAGYRVRSTNELLSAAREGRDIKEQIDIIDRLGRSDDARLQALAGAVRNRSAKAKLFYVAGVTGPFLLWGLRAIIIESTREARKDHQ